MFVLAYLAACRTAKSQALLLCCPVQLRLYSLTLKGDLFPGWPGAGWAWLSARQARFYVINNQLCAQCVILVKIQALEQLPNRTATTSTNLFCISLAFENVNWLIISIHIQGRKLIKAGRCRISRHIWSGVVCPGSLLELLEYLGSNSQEKRERALGRGGPLQNSSFNPPRRSLALHQTFPCQSSSRKGVSSENLCLDKTAPMYCEASSKLLTSGFLEAWACCKDPSADTIRPYFVTQIPSCPCLKASLRSRQQLCIDVNRDTNLPPMFLQVLSAEPRETWRTLIMIFSGRYHILTSHGGQTVSGSCRKANSKPASKSPAMTACRPILQVSPKLLSSQVAS